MLSYDGLKGSAHGSRRNNREWNREQHRQGHGWGKEELGLDWMEEMERGKGRRDISSGIRCDVK